MLKRLYVIILPFILLGCVDFEKENREAKEQFIQNNYNLELTKTYKYNGISFKLPENFKQNYSKNYTINNASFTRTSNPLKIYFSVESFDESDLQRKFISDFVIQDDLLNSFQDAYIWKRYESLNNGAISIKKTLPKHFKLNGVIQTVSGEGIYGSSEYYATSTIELNKKYYVFQWICAQEMMNYTFDDFEHILKSIRATK